MNILERTIALRPAIPNLIKGMSLVLMVGLIGFTIPPTREIFGHMTPLIVILGSLVLIWYYMGEQKIKFIFWTTFVIICGFLVEVAGVNTGLIFGEYTYGTLLGFKLWGTPLLLGINWFVVVYSSIGAIEEMSAPLWLKIPFTGVLVTAFDIVLEPVAIGLNMWTWEGGSVPFQNYFAWFLIGVLFTSLYHLLGLKSYNSATGPVYLSMFMFFLLLNLVLLF